MREEYKDKAKATSAAKKARKEQEKAAKAADKRQNAVDLAKKRIETQAANAELAVKLKQARREQRQEAFAELEKDLEDAGLAGTSEARFRKQVMTADFSRNKHTQVKGGYAQMSLDMMQTEARASEARERVARGEFSAGVRYDCLHF